MSSSIVVSNTTAVWRVYERTSHRSMFALGGAGRLLTHLVGVELRRSEASGCCLLVAIGQGECRVVVALDAGLRCLRAKLLGAGGKLPRRLGGSLQAFVDRGRQPSLAIGDVRAKVSLYLG